MKYSEDQPSGRYALVISGDGKTEKRILTRLAPEFNGRSSSLFYPTVAMKGSTTGLVGLIKGLKVAAGIPPKNEMHALLLIDKEHIADTNIISTTAASLGCSFQVQASGTAFIHGILRFGSKIITTFIAVVGTKKSVEEEVAILVKLTLGKTVVPHKAEIRRFLDQHKTSLDELLSRATIAQLKASFVGICAAIAAMEQELGTTDQ